MMSGGPVRIADPADRRSGSPRREHLMRAPGARGQGGGVIDARAIALPRPRTRALRVAAFVGGELLVQAVTQGPAGELLYGNFPEHSRYPASI